MKLFPVAIIAGGLGTRLKSLTDKVPKSMIDINGEPFIAYQLRLLKASSIEKVVILIGYLGEMIKEFVGDGEVYQLTVEYSHDGPSLLGTAGAIKKALPLLGDTFFILYGDSYLECDFSIIQEKYRQSNRPAMMTIVFNDDRWDKSNVVYRDGCIIDYDKKDLKPEMQYIDYGIGVFHRSCFDHVPENEKIDLGSVYKNMITEGKLAGFLMEKRFYEIGSITGLKELKRFISSKNCD